MSKYDVNKIKVVIIDRESAKKCVLKNHYMATFPAGSKLYFGVIHEGFEGLVGVCVFGLSTGTNAKLKMFPDFIKAENIIEMQRLWISDDMGMNAESKTLSLIIDIFKKRLNQIKIIWTYAGGCKNDCGIVYQSSGFQFLGSEKCDDFYLTKNNQYKNIINALRFGKGPPGEKDRKKIAEYLWGEGQFIQAHRHFYFYSMCKKTRRVMESKTKPFPKYSERYRLNQSWV